MVTERRAGRTSRSPPRRLLTWICRRWPAFVLGPDLNRSESAVKLSKVAGIERSEIRDLSLDLRGTRSSLRAVRGYEARLSQGGWIEPAHGQHGDIVGRKRRPDEAADCLAD